MEDQGTKGKVQRPAAPAVTTKVPAPPPPAAKLAASAASAPTAITRTGSLGTPHPASHTARDRGIEVRMAIAVANTMPNDIGELKLDPGMRLRQYELIRLIGKGGMGQVFLAR